MLVTEEDFREYEKKNAFMAHNHIRICKAEPECSIVSVKLADCAMNLSGFVHGGLFCAMADCVAGIAARADGGQYVTQSAHINFLSNVRGGTVFAKAEEVKRGRSIAVFHVSVTDEAGKLLADCVVDMFKTAKAVSNDES